MEKSQEPAVAVSDTEKKVPQTFNFKSLHFGWFIGHGLVVLNSLLFFLSTLIFHHSGFFYRISYLAVIVSYGIVLYNSYKPFTSNEPYFKRMLLDENTQYLIIAIYFLFSKLIAVTLLPFFIYSVFHILDYVEKDLIPNVAPHQSKIQNSIQNLINQYHEKAMILVSKIEVFGVMMQLVLGLFVFRTSILSILLYTHFLRMRYYMSNYTREFLNELSIKIDQLLTPPTAHPKIPPTVIKAYATAKDKLANKPITTTTTAATPVTKKKS